MCRYQSLIIISILLVSHCYILINNSSQLDMKYNKIKYPYSVIRIIKAVLRMMKCDFEEIKMILY